MFRWSFRSLTSFAAEWCALSGTGGEKDGRRGSECLSQKTFGRRPSFSPFDPKHDAPFRQATIGAGGISDSQEDNITLQ